ncbi:MAG: MarR family transcriptional regulator [Melioribacteraceae bacterium]|jgi:DNA-binding MarR family transcriptional regulator|nr:MarR family transcriptional regulator [Melioribacteraceae bacterium]
MLLEEEIKQSKFKSEFQKLAVNIFFTHGWLISKHAKTLKKFGITTSQYNILRILRGQHPNTAPISLLKERMLDKMSDASRLVERLRTKGLLSRKICIEDRRRVNVLISKKGLDLLAKLDEYDKESESYLSKISKSEAKELNTLLDKMRG